MTTLDDILAAVCRAFDVSRSELARHTTRRADCLPRFAFGALARTHTGVTWREIGHAAGGFDHTSAIYWQRQHDGLMTTDAVYRRRVRAAELYLAGSSPQQMLARVTLLLSQERDAEAFELLGLDERVRQAA